ncbi:MAG: hypothetical protein J5I98_20110 [Phaeodactylibacter sp.]|nr:hypothetical protein [Phaeodactylibacter sp.]
MTASLRFQATALAVVLCIGLFFALKQATLPFAYTPPPSYEEVPGFELTRMSPTNLEVYLRGLLEKVRNGEAISYGREQSLKEVRQAIIDNMAGQPEILALLLAIIDEILLLKSLFGGGALAAKMADLGFLQRHF